MHFRNKSVYGVSKSARSSRNDSNFNKARPSLAIHLTIFNLARSHFFFVSQCSRGRTVGRPLRTKIRKVRTFFLTQESWDAHIFYPRRQKYKKGRSLCYTRVSSARNLKGRTNYQTRASSVRQAKHHRARRDSDVLDLSTLSRATQQRSIFINVLSP